MNKQKTDNFLREEKTMIKSTQSKYAVVIVCAFILQFAVFLFQPVRADAKPNIIIIQADNLGWGDVCAMQSRVFEQNTDLCSISSGTNVHPGTENIDTLAKHGVTMTNFHAAAPSCSPSRASLLTGMHARRHGVSNQSGQNLNFPDTLETLASLLKGVGYNTSFLGKWHLGTLPEARGFDSFYVTPGGAAPGMYGFCIRERKPGLTVDEHDKFYITHNHGNPAFVDTICNDEESDTMVNWWEFVTIPYLGKAKTKSMSEVLTDKSVEYIDTLRTLNQPVFLYLNYTSPHSPLDVEISDTPYYYDDGLASNVSDVVSYQQYRTRIRTVTGSSCSGQFTVGQYIYSANTGTWGQATSEGARGRIISTDGNNITYYLLGPRDFIGPKPEENKPGDRITEYTGYENGDASCSAITADSTGYMKDFNGWFDPNLTGYRTLSCPVSSGSGTFTTGNLIYTGTWKRNLPDRLGKITNVEGNIITYKLIINTQDFSEGNLIKERLADGSADVPNVSCTAGAPSDAGSGSAPSYYNQAIKEVDNGVGRILSKISELPGGADNTIVIFLSDNGAFMGTELQYWRDPATPPMRRNSTGGLRGGYPFLYEGGARVPFIAKWKNGGWGAVGSSLSTDQLADVTDILPTLLTAAGVKMPSTPIDGVDLSDVLTNVAQKHKKTVHYHFFPARKYYGTPTSTSPDTESFPYAIWSYDPSRPQNSSLNFAKLLLDFDYTPKELYNVDPDPITGDLREGYNIVSSSTDTVALQKESAAFLNSLGGFVKQEQNVTIIANRWLYASARDPNEPRTNLRLQFFDSNYNFVGQTSNMLSLVTGATVTRPITDFCSGLPFCNNFTGVIKIFTDKPTYVTTFDSADSSSGQTPSVGPSRTLVFPTIADGIGGADTSLIITNPTPSFLNVVITAITTTYTGHPNDIPYTRVLDFLNPSSTQTITRYIDSHQTYTYKPSAFFTNGFYGRVRVDALAKDDFHNPIITGVAEFSRATPKTPIPPAYAGNLAKATDDSFVVSSGTTTTFDIMKNDYDAPNQPPQIKSVDASNLQGTIINRGSYVEYIPPAFATCDTFTYTIKTEEGDIPVGAGYPRSSATVTISVNNGCSATPLSITTAGLPDGYLTIAYSATLAATGGQTPYTWSITSGTLPAGLSLNASTGAITGTPTAAGAQTITFEVRDATTTTATKSLTITIYALPSISTTSLANGTIGTAYSQTLAATGGKTPYTWSINSGSLPAGLSLNASTGAITGTPTSAGTSTITFQVADANGKTATKPLSITITAPPVAQLNDWSNIHSSGTQTSTTVSAGSITVNSGSNRLLLVSVVMEVNGTASSPTITAIYSGTTVSQVKVVSTTSSQTKEVVWIGSLKESQIAGNGAMTITYSGIAPSNVIALHVKWAAFSGVNQSLPFAGVGGTSTSSTTPTFGSTITYKTNGMTTIVSGNGGSSANGAITATPLFTAGIATKSDGQSSNTFTTAKHTTNSSYASSTKVTWSGTTTKWSGLVVVSMQP